MKTSFSKTWVSSSQPRKQRKYIYNAPLHIKRKFLSCHLSKDLRTNHKMRSITIRSGDKVKIMRGQFKNKSGKVDRINTKDCKVYITGIDFTKKEGTKVQRPFHPSNLMITELNLTDRVRMSKTKITKTEPPKKQATPEVKNDKKAS